MKSAFKFIAILVATLSLTSCWEAKEETSLSELAQGLMIRGQRRVLTGVCHGLTVHAVSKNGSLLPDSTPLELRVQLGGAGSYIDEAQAVHLNPTQSLLYSDENCLSSTTFVKADGVNPARVYVMSSAVENVLLVATDKSNALRLTSASLQTFGPTRIRVTSFTNVIAGVCSTPITAVPIDPGGQPFRVGWSENFVPSDTTNGVFYLDANCNQPMPSTGIAIPRSETPVTFYYRNTQGAPSRIRVGTILNSLTPETRDVTVLRPALLSMAIPTTALVTTLGTSLDFDVQVSNSGQVSATNVNYSIAAPFTQIANTSTCTNVLAAGGTCNLRLRFTPLQSQSYTVALTANYFNGASNVTASRTITATGQLPAGSDDPLFNGGVVTIAGSVANRPFATIVSNSKVLVAQTNPATGNLLMARVNPNGTLDTAFGTNGRILFAPPQGLPVIRGIQAQLSPSGAAMLVGELNGKLVLYRVNANGSIQGPMLYSVDTDPSQAVDDVSVIASAPYNNSVVVALISEGRFVVARFTENFAPDPSFGTGGFVTENMTPSQLGALTVHGDGRISAGLNIAGDAFIYRYNSDGSPDNAFANAPPGRQALAAGDTVRALTTIGDRTYIGVSNAGNNFALRRMALDGGFEAAANVDFGGVDIVNSLAIQNDNKVLAAGRSAINSALVRLDQFLGLDALFGNTGRVVRTGTPSAEAFHVFSTADGVYTVGVANNTLTIRRQTAAIR